MCESSNDKVPRDSVDKDPSASVMDEKNDYIITNENQEPPKH